MLSPQELGMKIRDRQNEILATQSSVEAVRLKLLDTFNTPLPRVDVQRRISVRVAFAATAAMVATAAVLVILLTPLFDSSSSITASVDSEAEALRPGDWIGDSVGKPVAVQFSDGSEMQLQPKSGARITRLDKDGAGIQLEQGFASVHVVPRKDASWTFDAGPFSIRVLGTAFRFSWSPEKGLFSLKLEKGKVSVTGPTISGARQVVEGESVTLSVNQSRVEHRLARVKRTDSSRRSPDRRVNPVLSPNLETLPDNKSRVQKRQFAYTPRRSPRRSVSKFARRTDPVEEPPVRALATDAPRQDTTQLFQNKMSRVGKVPIISPDTKTPNSVKREELPTADQLSVRANRARLAGQIASAKTLYRSLREQYPRSNEAALAAFMLGRITFDENRDYVKAAQWFSIYLDEQHGQGPIREARGRLIEAYYRSGRKDAAQTHARKYLKDYPDGPHARLAQKIISEIENSD